MPKRKILYSMFNSIVYKRHNPELVISAIYKTNYNYLTKNRNKINIIKYEKITQTKKK